MRFGRLLSPVLSLLCCLLLAGAAWADDLHLKDGRVIEAEEVWQVGDSVWYRQGKVIASVATSEVVRITKPKPAAAAGAAGESIPAAKSRAKVSKQADSGEKEIVTRAVSRIVLKDGTSIDADSVWEDAERIGYRLGKMQAFVDRAEVKGVYRNLTTTEERLPVDLNLRFSTGHRGLDQLIVYSGAKYQIDPLLIYLVMREESRFNYRAVSRAGARGLMQLMPGTAARLGVRHIHDPVENVEAGSRHLRRLLELFNGDVNLALAAYNAGEDAVLRYGRRIPPYRETMNYVWRINTAYRHAMAGSQFEDRQN